jgi:Holliday junction resolvase RusA-like endonuclease
MTAPAYLKLFQKLPTPGKELAFLVYPGRAYPLSRPRFAKGHVYQPLDNQKALREWLYENGPETIEGDVWVDCFFLFKTKQEPDCDNLVKAVHDALQSSLCILNDRRVCGGTFARAMGAEENALVIIIREVIYFDPKTLPDGSRKSSIRSVKKPSARRRSSPNGIGKIAS